MRIELHLSGSGSVGLRPLLQQVGPRNDAESDVSGLNRRREVHKRGDQGGIVAVR